MKEHYPSLRALLQAAGMKQTELAKALELSDSLISKFALKETKPQRSLLKVLAGFLLVDRDIGDLTPEDYMAKCLRMETVAEILAKH